MIVEFLGGITQELSERHSTKRGLCLGLGSPSTSIDSRWQLVLLLDLVNRFGIDPPAIEIYDPLFTQDEISQLQSLGLSILSENLGGRHTIDQGTLLYLPHCPMVLLERLLRANWSREKLETLVLVGNDVGEWIEGRRSHQAKYTCIERIVPFLSSTSFPPDAFGVATTAFAGISFQVVKFDVSPPKQPGAADLQLGGAAPARKKKRRPTMGAETLGPALLPTDDSFWDLPEEDSSLAHDQEVL